MNVRTQTITVTIDGDVVEAEEIAAQLGGRVLISDPGLAHTATVSSAVTMIDGREGVLAYRGIPVERAVREGDFAETARLLADVRGMSSDEWRGAIVAALVDSTAGYTAPLPGPSAAMHAYAAGWTALAAEDPLTGTALSDEDCARLLGRALGVGARIIARAAGRDGAPEIPRLDADVSHAFLNAAGIPDPDDAQIRAVDTAFILHADHGQNCSTTVVRAAASARAQADLAIACGIGALAGPLHGGANQAVIAMLRSIGSPAGVPDFLDRVRRKEGGVRLMGFGNRLYRTYDPRAALMRDAFLTLGTPADDPLVAVARELERSALADDYFVSRRLYPNIDYYSALLFRSLGFAAGSFPVLFAIARTAGWIAQYREEIASGGRIVRPDQRYVGPRHS